MSSSEVFFCLINRLWYLLLMWYYVLDELSCLWLTDRIYFTLRRPEFALISQYKQGESDNGFEPELHNKVSGKQMYNASGTELDLHTTRTFWMYISIYIAHNFKRILLFSPVMSIMRPVRCYFEVCAFCSWLLSEMVALCSVPLGRDCLTEIQRQDKIKITTKILKHNPFINGITYIPQNPW